LSVDEINEKGEKMMRKLKKWAALLLTATLVLSLAVTAFAAVDDTGFSDVDAGVWYTDAVAYVTENRLMDPISTNRFAPDTDATRAALAVALYRAAGSPQVGAHGFNDIPAGSSYANAAAWAQTNGVIAGYDNGGFGGEDFITREQIVTILWRYAGSPTPGASQDFTDESAISAYASQAVDWSRENGVVNGYDNGRFGPQDHTTRAQLAVILRGFLTRNQPATPEVPDENAKVLVAYFSGTGTTRRAAENIAAALGSDAATLHEITPVQPYTSADLDYTNSNCRSVTEQHDPSARPAIANSVVNMDQYDVVFLGYPIWNNDAPRIIYTFLEHENLSGKTIVPFCTSGGSGIANSVSNIRGLTSGATWAEGRRCSSSDTTNTLTNWINGLGLTVTPSSEATPTPSNETKVLVAYFSATNTTRPLAEYIADGLDADIYEIVPETPYTSADLNYGNSSSRTSVEMNDPNSRPAISGSVSNMDQYDIVFIGYPIWWGEAPRIVSTFFESYNFSGKTIVPFCTSGSSGIGSSARNLHSLTNGATWLDGRRFSGGTSRNTMISWVNDLGLDITAN